MVNRILNKVSKDLVHDGLVTNVEFTDSAMIPEWASSSIGLLYTLGALDKDSSGNVNPHGEITRKEAAELVEKLYQAIVAYTSCQTLSGLEIPSSDFAMATSGATINLVTLVAENEADNQNGQFCKVLGAIHPVDKTAPDINFEVNLPTNWNQKALQFGGGGFNGTLITGLGGILGQVTNISNPLGAGYATFGSDSGHKSEAAFDASFGLNEEALNNFASDQLNKTYDAAMVLIENHYGSLPEQMYFAGASEGGREALTVIQKWPDLYDGVIAYYPVINIMLLQLTDNYYAQTIYANEGEGFLNPEKVKLINDTVIEACDSLDGVEDGIISNVGLCEETFTINTLTEKLRSVDGTDTGNDSLSDAQINTVRVLNEAKQFDFEFNNGVDSFPKSMTLLGGDRSIFTLGTNPIPQSPPAWNPVNGDSFHAQAGDTNIRYLITQDVSFDSLTFDPNDYQERIQELSELLNFNSVDIEKYKENGGKLILVTGMVDTAVTPYNTIGYYEGLVEKFGQESLDEFVTFYTIPGYGHGHGPFNSSIDTLGALDEWVTNGNAPGTLLAIDKNEATNGRTRPACIYPAYPVYNGTGEVNAAENFTCTIPENE